jgi:hypothetical protein
LFRALQALHDRSQGPHHVVSRADALDGLGGREDLCSPLISGGRAFLALHTCLALRHSLAPLELDICDELGTELEEEQAQVLRPEPVRLLLLGGCGLARVSAGLEEGLQLRLREALRHDVARELLQRLGVDDRDA